VVPKDVAGVFARPFIIGHFLPAFFALGVAALLSTSAAAPEDLRNATSFGIQLLLIGAAALPVGLLLSNMQAHVIRTFSGEATEPQRVEDELSAERGFGWWSNGPVRRAVRKLFVVNPKRGLAWLHRSATANQRRKMEGWKEQLHKRSLDIPRGWAHLDQEFPNQPEQLLPTRLGNGIRAYQTYPHSRYGLDGTAIWPRIEMLLSAEERSVIADAKTEVAFFLNCAVCTLAVSIWVAVDTAVHRSCDPVWLGVDVVVTGACFWLLQLLAVTATFRVGPPVRAAVDLHRLELYDLLGARRPASADDEKRIASAINGLVNRGEPLPCGVRAVDPAAVPRKRF